MNSFKNITNPTNEVAPVSGFARSFISGKSIVNATITILETGNTFETDNQGKFGPFFYPVGMDLTLELQKPGTWWTGYQTTQTATMTVPEKGFDDSNYLNNISFQVPSNLAFKILPLAMGVKENKNLCQIAATITPPHTNMDDIPQGVEGVTATLEPDPNVKPFYFGMFPLIHKTNPLDRTLKSTSLDGGVAFLNVPEGAYTLKAKKDDIIFSQVQINARRGVLVNASPPHGPTMLQDSQQKNTAHVNRFGLFKNASTIACAAIGFTAAGPIGAAIGAGVGRLASNAAESLSENCKKMRK